LQGIEQKRKSDSKFSNAHNELEPNPVGLSKLTITQINQKPKEGEAHIPILKEISIHVYQPKF